jgi:adenosylcobinamide kinase/adenosylcobinamide-phosphate guanylyltransferase
MSEKKCILLIGGARSGKSHFAQEFARKSGKSVLFVATAEALDDEMKRRIEAHRQDRPTGWQTLEAPQYIGGQISRDIGSAQIVIVDCITLLMSNVFNRYPESTDASIIEEAGLREIRELVDCITNAEATFVIVTNEVGMDVVPPTELGRIYRDLLGRANQLLAERADEVLLMVAGIPLRIKPAPAL